MQIETFTPPNIMKPLGPYSHIAKAGPFIFISATAGVDPATDLLAGPDVYSQTRQILLAFGSMLETLGSNMEQVVHIHVFLKDMDQIEEMDRACREAFGSHQPARTLVGVSALPKPGALLTMNLNAVTDETAG